MTVGAAAVHPDTYKYIHTSRSHALPEEDNSRRDVFVYFRSHLIKISLDSMIEQRCGTGEVLEAVLEGASVRVSCTEYVCRRLGY